MVFVCCRFASGKDSPSLLPLAKAVPRQGGQEWVDECLEGRARERGAMPWAQGACRDWR